MESTFVIIGGGISGVTCAKSLAFLSPEESTLLITSNSLIKVVTNVVPLGKVSMQLNISKDSSVSLTSDNPSIKILNETVRRIDPESKTLETESKKLIKFKKLCICTGARPRLICEDNPLVLGIRDTESVENFSRRIPEARRIVVVGNGGIATEIVYKIKNVEIVWVIKDRHISATFVDPGAAEFFQSKLSREESSSEHSKENINFCKRIKYTATKMGKSKEGVTGAALGPDWHQVFAPEGLENSPSKVEIEYECEVSRVMTPEAAGSTGWPVFAELTNGKIVGCDFIVSATGVTPNTDIIGLEGIEKSEDGGLLVDWKLETSCEDVYAAGDACTANWELSDHWFQMRLWTQAYQMGCYAAKSMVSTLRSEHFLQDFSFELFTHVTRFFGYKIVLLGLYNGQKLSGDYEILLRMTKDEEYVKLVVKGGKLQGAVLIGETDLEEVCENLILNQLDVSIYGEDLLDPNIDIEDYFD
ncbi:pyridine nucleotide-disulfide oxidoreductase domain-containing protein 1 [Diachasma alloeum]|uniref:pyridine nucleotide-disulfide oxidoreductase domain-containing protein 1 n=1 Tax=Diachasma alloeum TaxID=454923 RepID=UPI000738215A|nr:pyridine nucleotide-disulfide oxidoreductase domain-containing protein 1 [Diachasma alloeum]